MKFDESIPIYLQIKEEIENAIISEALKEDDPIPSIRLLAQQYRLNPQTIANAVSELLNDGYLYKKRGIGMFVEKGAKERLTRRKSEEFLDTDLRKIILRARSLGFEKQELLKVMDDIFKEQEDENERH